MAEYLGKQKKSTPTPENVSNSSSPVPVKSTPEKIDDDELKSRLTELEEDWKKTEAKGSFKDEERILADEFTNIDGEGKKYTKAQWINEMSGGNPELKSWTFTDKKIESNTGETAIMSLVVNYTYKDGTIYKTRDIDKFVYRDERWQVVSSQSTVIK
ncbi:hypothetical protein BH10ACI1_BH10ACI1_28480 [soil metagenome]